MVLCCITEAVSTNAPKALRMLTMRRAVEKNCNLLFCLNDCEYYISNATVAL